MIYKWKRVTTYKGWVIERAVLTGDKWDSLHRARKEKYTMYADFGLAEDNTVLDLMQQIDRAEVTHRETLAKAHSLYHYDSYEDALEYATKRLDFGGMTTTTAYVGSDKWKFVKKGRNKIVAVIVARNVL